MHALDNCRHEAFAFALAAGESVAGAYDAAGFHPKNRKARSEALSQQPDVIARVKHLVETVPNLMDLWRSHAPSFDTMPAPSGRETASEAARRVRTRVASPKQTARAMNGWLWQVLTGRRKVHHLQMQAARLYARINHWDRAPKKGDAPTAPPLRLVPGPVLQSLDLINAVNLAYEVQFNVRSPLEFEHEGDMDPAGATNKQNGDPADAENAVRPYLYDPLDLIHGPQVIPMWKNGDRNPHPQSLELQPSTLSNPENNEQNKTSPQPSEAPQLSDALVKDELAKDGPSDPSSAFQSRDEATPDSHPVPTDLTLSANSPSAARILPMISLARAFFLTLLCGVLSAFSEDLAPLPQIDDLYKTDAPTEPITLTDGKTAIYCRYRTDLGDRVVHQSLWKVSPEHPEPQPLEAGAPDGFSPMLSPDGRWIAFLSTRPFPNGKPAFTPVPPYSDTAADLWLIPVTGGKAIPLGGPAKPYGRIITDRFYGRVAFSPNGKRLVFVADEGRDPRTEAERKNDVIVVREDQGEGYEGYGPTQIWVADLASDPKAATAATKITRVTSDAYWYGDPQWSPDGAFLVVHANRTADQESARYSINHNFDLWKITLPGNKIQQLTTGLGPDFSPRISPDGSRLICLTSPRQGPHIDVFNLLIVPLKAGGPPSHVLFDHHGKGADHPPHLSPTTPLPDACWRDPHRVTFTSYRGVTTVPQTVDLEAGPQATEDPLPTAARSSLLPPSNPKLGRRLRAADEIVHWKSFDGLEIEGVLTLPPASVAQPPFKLLVYPHGGPHHRASSGGGPDVQIFATSGYAVFQPNFRGSTSYGKAFLDANRSDFGGGDMRDILTGIDHLVETGVADRDRQFLYGVSYGGFMTAWMVGRTHQFRAAAAQNSVTDLNVMWHLSDLQSWTEWEMGGLPWEVPDRMRAHSPLTFAAEVRTPTLILHSLNDRRCPVAMGRMFYRALKENHVPTEMVIYPNEGHGIRQLPHREDLLRRTLAWFQKYDLPKPKSAP
ncbi:MAG: S9 family peptidase [Prosthecobacter sp.]|nr:S9 family peptidase [Prosthecobacter sp.]